MRRAKEIFGKRISSQKRNRASQKLFKRLQQLKIELVSHLGENQQQKKFIKNWLQLMKE